MDSISRRFKDSRFARHIVVCAVALTLLGCSKQTSPRPVSVPNIPLVTIGSTPDISGDALNLIVNFEVSSPSYYEKAYSHPTWPEADSGVTVGIGYDCGYESKTVILSDWSKVNHVEELGDSAGLKGTSAKVRCREIQDILVHYPLAIDVFRDTDITRYFQLCSRIFPGFTELRLNAQGALISLVYNRGSSMIGASRLEMRNIREMVRTKDYNGMANQIERMKRLWIGTPIEDGMNNRRDAEAELMLTP